MDELGDVGSVASVVESSTMTVIVPSGDESMMGNMEGEVEDSYDGEDGEDLMIEVVGSDVFVDGMSGNDEGKEDLERGIGTFGNDGMIEGGIGSKEGRDLEGQFWDGRTETGVGAIQGVPPELDEMSGQVIEKEVVEAQRVESVREEGEGGGTVKEQVHEGAELVDGGDKAPGKVSQGTGVLDHEVWNPGIDGVGVSSSSLPEQESSVDKEGLTKKDEILGDNVGRDGVTFSGKDQNSDVEMVETVPEPSDKDNVHHAGANFLDNPAEAVLRKHVGLVDTEETVPAGTRNTETNVDDQCFQSSEKDESVKDDRTVDNTSHGNSSVDTLSSSELSNSVRKTEIVELVDIPLGKFEDSGVEPEAPFSDGKNEATPEPGAPFTDGKNEATPEPEAPFTDGKNEATRSEDFPIMKQETLCGSHDDIHAALESSLGQSSVIERAEWIAMDIDEVLDFKDEAVVLDAPDSGLSSTGNVQESSGKSIMVSDFTDAAKSASSVTETGVNDVKNSVDFRSGEGHVQSGLSVVKEHVGLVIENFKGVAEIKDTNIREVPDCNAAIKDKECNTLDVSGITEKKVVAGENLLSSSEPNGAVIPVERATESQVAVAVCNTTHGGPLLSEINDNKVDIGALRNGEDGAPGNNPTEVLVGIANTSILQTDSNTVMQVDVPEIKSNGDEKDVSPGERYPDDREVEKKNYCCQTDGNGVIQDGIPEVKSYGDEKEMTVGEQYHDDRQAEHGKEDISMGENASDMDPSKAIEEKTTKTPSSVSIGQPGYLLGPGNEVEFSITDLVWGKVRSHPWWPGQIFDPADGSDKAVKYYKKDCFLVAYFGDRTFAWNDASLLKPFRQYFSQIEKQSGSEAFQNAVNCALDEVSRRVKLGLSCSCMARDAHERIECQIVENTGIREESSRRYGVDKSTGATSFEPDKLLQYMKSLAESPFCLVDRLELVLAQAQLSAFCCFKGYREPPTFESRDAMLEKNVQASKLSDSFDQAGTFSNDDEQLSSPHKHKQNQKDSLHSRKERSLSELMGEREYSPDDEDDSDGKALSKSISTPSGKKRKAVDSLTDGSDRRISFYAAKVSTTSSSPRPSFKVGDCIRRVASQLTGSAPGLKGINEQAGMDSSLPTSEDTQQGTMVVPTEISSLEEMLSQLQLAARDPKKGYSFLSNIIVFFSGFRNSVVRKHHASGGKSGGSRKRKADHTAVGATEEFEFDDVNDSYWTDRIVQNYSEEQLLQISENGDRDYQLVASDANKVRKSGRGSHSRKRYSNGNYETLVDEQTADVDRKKLELLPAELMLIFAQGDSLPSEVNLNKMFRRFGPLKESETEVDLDSHRARVIFKRGVDAEAAYSSAGRINIFGSMVVSYQLNYSPSTNFSLPLLMLEGTELVT